MKIIATVHNILPDRYPTWTYLMQDIINSKDPAVSWEKQNLFVLDLAIEDAYGAFSGYKIFKFEKDFIKARVLDELWEDLDLNQSAIHEIRMIAGSIGARSESPINDNFRKIWSLSNIRGSKN